MTLNSELLDVIPDSIHTSINVWASQYYKMLRWVIAILHASQRGLALLMQFARARFHFSTWDNPFSARETLVAPLPCLVCMISKVQKEDRQCIMRHRGQNTAMLYLTSHKSFPLQALNLAYTIIEQHRARPDNLPRITLIICGNIWRVAPLKISF